MSARSWGVVFVLLVALVGCTKQIFTIDGKTSEDWAKGLSSARGEDRLNAMSNLAIFAEHDPDAVPLLAKGLEDPEGENRRAAIRLLRNLGPKAKTAVPALQAAASKDPSLRSDVNEAVAAIQAPPAK